MLRTHWGDVPLAESILGGFLDVLWMYVSWPQDWTHHFQKSAPLSLARERSVVHS